MLTDNIKKYFPWFKNNKSWTYLDSSATSLKPQCVIDDVTSYYEKYGTNPHNSDSKLAYDLILKLKSCRQNIASFFNAKNNEIIFTSGATDGLNLICQNLINWLKPNDEVLLSYGEHSSNLLPWLMNEKTKKYKIVYAKDKNNFPSEQAFISSITKKTRIISLSTTNSLFGVSINIKNIVAVARKINKNIIIVVDATQTAPSQGFDFKNTDVDLFVCSSHKMLGPNGVGILGGKFSILNKFTSIKIGGGSVSTVENDKINFSPIPERLEPGTPNVEGIIGFNSAINFIKKIGIKNIIKHEKELKKYIDQKIIKIKNIDYPSYGTDFPICSFNIKGVSPQDLANYLGNKKIIVRGGMSCVKMISKFASPSGYVRASFYLYNTKKDIDKLIYELKKYKPGNELKNIV